MLVVGQAVKGGDHILSAVRSSTSRTIVGPGIGFGFMSTTRYMYLACNPIAKKLRRSEFGKNWEAQQL